MEKCEHKSKAVQATPPYTVWCLDCNTKLSPEGDSARIQEIFKEMETWKY